jgi:hypothetical protein
LYSPDERALASGLVTEPAQVLLALHTKADEGLG